MPVKHHIIPDGASWEVIEWLRHWITAFPTCPARDPLQKKIFWYFNLFKSLNSLFFYRPYTTEWHWLEQMPIYEVFQIKSNSSKYGQQFWTVLWRDFRLSYGVDMFWQQHKKWALTNELNIMSLWQRAGVNCSMASEHKHSQHKRGKFFSVWLGLLAGYCSAHT